MSDKNLTDALWERDAYFAEADRVKETLADVIPALERASGLKADDFRRLNSGALTGDEIAALWMARAILESPTDHARTGNRVEESTMTPNVPITKPARVECQIKGCKRTAVVEISGASLKKPGWWRACQTHRYVFAAQRPLKP